MKIQGYPSRFSWVIDSAVARGDAVWDEIVASNDHFVVVPSKGSLVPGWLLAVPRRAMMNLSTLEAEEREALQELVNGLQPRMTKFDGEAFCFEHGSAHVGSLTGCGVDQAHLHIVPLPFDLVEAALKSGDEQVKWRSLPESETLTRLPTLGEYVAVWRLSTGVGHIGSMREPVSQWMRRTIARNLGMESQWDYRTHPQEATIRATLRALTAAPSAVTVR